MSRHDANSLRRVEFTQFVGFGKADLILQGWFHRWSGEPQVVAIVEADDGQVFEVQPRRLKFLKSEIPDDYDDLLTR